MGHRDSSSISFLLLGMDGDFTGQVIDTLLNHGCKPVAVVLYGESFNDTIGGVKIELQRPGLTWLDRLASEQVTTYFSTTKTLIPLLEKHKPDILLTACWPRLLPNKVLQCAQLASLNIHPSLLPKFPGANPLRDQLSTDDKQFGVTLHQMNEHYDEGEILSQSKISSASNADLKHIEQQCASSGASLFIEALKDK